MAANTSDGTQSVHPAAGDEKPKAAPPITPELITQIADRVYTLLILDLKITQERRGARLTRGGYR